MYVSHLFCGIKECIRWEGSKSWFLKNSINPNITLVELYMTKREKREIEHKEDKRLSIP
jgi:hypothetical protein